MDKLDKFNQAVMEIGFNWRVLFYFVAGIYVLTTILAIGRESNTALLIISWIVVVLGVVILTIFSGKKEKSSSKSSG